MDILVLFYSRHGATRRLAERIAAGIDCIAGATARMRTVPPVAPVTEVAASPVPPSGSPYVELRDLEECGALALGSPARFGNVAAPIKHFLDGTGTLWHAGALAGKPAALFTWTSTMHRGQESTLLSMMLPLLHHGMLIVGLPYTERDLFETRSSGTPYGASHLARDGTTVTFTESERRLAVALGRRLAQVALRLAA